MVSIDVKKWDWRPFITIIGGWDNFLVQIFTYFFSDAFIANRSISYHNAGAGNSAFRQWSKKVVVLKCVVAVNRRV